MSELLTFAHLGFLHITDPRGADHVLFILVLAAIYRLRDWRQAVAVVTAFTVGHSVTLALAVTGVLHLPTALIEFLIPVTIVATAAENLLVRDRAGAPWRGRYRPVFAGVFGLVHGAGFANYLRSLFVDGVAVPLLGFNLGIEAGQVAVLAAATVLFAGLDRLLGGLRAPSPFRLRVVAVSAVIAVVAAGWAVERSPW
ncbi:MAG: HupE/UreJ family protein [Longimicrobiaceae bacterium]